MRVALLSYNAQLHNAVGNQIAEKVRFFQERGAEVRLFVQDARRLHPGLRSCAIEISTPKLAGPAWDYVRQTDLVFAVYAQYHDLLQYLPSLAGTGPRIVFDYLGVTPPALWRDQHREGLEKSVRQRGYVWCADYALTTSHANRRELVEATNIPAEHVTTMPLAVDVERFHAEPGDRFLQQKLGIEGRIALYVGRLASNKRVPLLIEAVARLNDPSLHVVIVGDCADVYAAEAARCLALADQVGLAERVHFAGAMDDVDLPRAYRSAEVLVIPSVHEGFCVPVIEAMAAGCPVIASRSAALPETVGDAGLTFAPDEADDLACQLRRVLDDSPAACMDRPRRIAVVSFRFGPDIVGGAETSLGTLAQALQHAGHQIEVFTTCTKSESNWKNELAAGPTTLAGLAVHRFPVDPHDHAAHGETVRTILEADGRVPPDMEERYLRQSIHSSALLDELRKGEFDAIITGPYLFGLTAEIVREFSGKTLLVPCFHDEALARLALWPRIYSNVGGILFHSVEEQAYAQAQLGVNHPNTAVIGTCLPAADQCASSPPAFPRPYVVYCGRYSEQKNVPLLLEWAQRYHAQHPGALDFVFMGQGEIQFPAEPWLRNLGRVAEDVKRAVLAGAEALIQLSRQESLSLVALEAWREGTAVIVHRDCAVLVGQVERSQGGAAVADYETFAGTLDDLLANESTWRQRGLNGRTYVETNYLSAQDYVSNISYCLDRLRKPIRQQMRERGLERAQGFSRVHWQRRFAEFVEQVLTQPARPCREELRIEPLRSACRVGVDAGTFLLPVRLRNDGTHAVVPEGPGRTVLGCEIRDQTNNCVVMKRTEIALPALLAPGQTQAAALPIALPADAGAYRIRLWAERMDAVQGGPANTVDVPLFVEAGKAAASVSCVSGFLDTIEKTLPKAHHLQQLPADYVDVTEGQFAPVKRFIKRKVLHNFKHAYVDVLSRQQTQVNGHLVLMIQQLAECCALLDHAVTGLHQRMDQLEARIEQNMASAPACEPEPVDDRQRG